MNGSQKVAMWLGIILIVFFGLVTPWKQDIPIRGLNIERSLGYSFFLNPPEEGKGSIVGSDVVLAEIDYRRLFLHWFLIALVTLGLILSFGNRRKKIKTMLNKKEKPSEKGSSSIDYDDILD